MLPDMHIVSIDFDTDERHDWRPADPSDCDVWATVNVGNERGAAHFQLHICTRSAMRRIENKRDCFTIDEFRSVPELVDELNEFIEQRVAHQPGDPYQILAKRWAWEYQDLNKGTQRRRKKGH